jgi:RimJ/RimL family protein N-acetyltransferase
MHGVDVQLPRLMESPRLRLRPIREEDLAHVVALHREPEVMRYVGRGRTEHRESVLQWARSAGDRVLVAHRRGAGQFVGWFAAWPVESGELALECRLTPRLWSRGFGAEGMRAVLDASFRSPEVERVRATTMMVNVGGRRVLQRAGLRYVRTSFPHEERGEGTLPGAEYGEAEYALHRSEWERLRP